MALDALRLLAAMFAGAVTLAAALWILYYDLADWWGRRG